jgi:predicted branched-subunit amino acid permease
VVLVAAALLNVRHVLLGAALRPRVGGGRTRRAALAWFMIDEAAGLALAAERPAFVLFVTGAMGYVAWISGTVFGLYGADLANLETVADAVFPVLFTGLAAMTIRNGNDAFRTGAAAALTVGVAYMIPDVRPILPAAVAASVSFFGGDR